MYTENFKASVQYNDWKGSAAADNADMNALRELLVKKNLIEADEFLIGVEMVDGAFAELVSVKCILFPLGGFDTVDAKLNSSHGAVDVRIVQFDMSLTEFFALFKRFNVVLSKISAFEGREYRAI